MSTPQGTALAFQAARLMPCFQLYSATSELLYHVGIDQHLCQVPSKCSFPTPRAHCHWLLGSFPPPPELRLQRSNHILKNSIAPSDCSEYHIQCHWKSLALSSSMSSNTFCFNFQQRWGSLRSQICSLLASLVQPPSTEPQGDSQSC